jgi:hypothetical protein
LKYITKKEVLFTDELGRKEEITHFEVVEVNWNDSYYSEYQNELIELFITKTRLEDYL